MTILYTAINDIKTFLELIHHRLMSKYDAKL